MAITQAFSVDDTVVTINGRSIDDWGQQDPPYQDEPIDPKHTLIRAQGGNAVALKRKNPGRRVTMYLIPGSADSAYMKSLMDSSAVITLSRNQVGATNAAIGTEGMIVNDDAITRNGATSISDDVYIMEFNDWSDIR